MKNDLVRFTDKTEKILVTFRDSIDKLKTTEIHPKMQTTNQNVLIDIYFDENKMNVWKDKCVKSSDYIIDKIRSKKDEIDTEKEKIRNEKNTNIAQLKNE